MSKSKFPGLGKGAQRLKKGLRKKDLLDRIEELERRLADLEKGSNPRPKRPEYPTIPGPYRPYEWDTNISWGDPKHFK